MLYAAYDRRDALSRIGLFYAYEIEDESIEGRKRLLKRLRTAIDRYAQSRDRDHKDHWCYSSWVHRSWVWVYNKEASEVARLEQ